MKAPMEIGMEAIRKLMEGGVGEDMGTWEAILEMKEEGAMETMME